MTPSGFPSFIRLKYLVPPLDKKKQKTYLRPEGRGGIGSRGYPKINGNALKKSKKYRIKI